MENGYAICLNKWALDKDIKNELGLLLIISSLCAEKGYCYASNEYLSELFNINKTLLSRKIKILADKNYITIIYKRRGAEIIGREIRLSKTITDDYRKSKPTIIENDKENNTSINNTSIKKDDDDSIYDFLQNNGFILTPIHYEIISQWEDTELTRYAIKLAVLNGVYKINYVDKILYNFKKDGITTVAQAEAQKKEKPKYEKKMSFSEKMDMWIKELEEEENGVSGS